MVLVKLLMYSVRLIVEGEHWFGLRLHACAQLLGHS